MCPAVQTDIKQCRDPSLCLSVCLSVPPGQRAQRLGQLGAQRLGQLAAQCLGQLGAQCLGQVSRDVQTADAYTHA